MSTLDKTVWRLQEDDIRCVINDRFPSIKDEEEITKLINIAKESFYIEGWPDYVEMFIDDVIINEKYNRKTQKNTETLLEQFNRNRTENERKTQNTLEIKRLGLANLILNKIDKDSCITAKIEKGLVERGQVVVKGFGCLCQNSFCSWQKGMEVYLTDFHKKWEDKGVSISYGIEGVYFSLNGARKTLCPLTIDVN